MGKLILGWLIRRWVYVAVVAGLLGAFGYTATKFYFKGQHSVVSANIKELQRIQDRREGIDKEINSFDDARVRSELRKWVHDAPTGSP